MTDDVPLDDLDRLQARMEARLDAMGADIAALVVITERCEARAARMAAEIHALVEALDGGGEKPPRALALIDGNNPPEFANVSGFTGLTADRAIRKIGSEIGSFRTSNSEKPQPHFARRKLVARAIVSGGL